MCARGAISGAAQLALQNGDVKNIAFATVTLTKQNYEILTDAEQADLAFDEGGTGSRMNMNVNEYQRKTDAKFATFKSASPTLRL
jgi:hypothetical protein